VARGIEPHNDISLADDVPVADEDFTNDPAFQMLDGLAVGFHRDGGARDHGGVDPRDGGPGAQHQEREDNDPGSEPQHGAIVGRRLGRSDLLLTTHDLRPSIAPSIRVSAGELRSPWIWPRTCSRAPNAWTAPAFRTR